MKTIDYPGLEMDLEKLIQGLEKEDHRNMVLTKTFTWIMWVMAPLYFAIFITAIIVDKPEIDKVGFLFFSLGFVAFALLFMSLNKMYKSVDYGITTVEMLKKAVDRYALWQMKTFLTLIPVILISIGFSFSMQRVIPHPDLFMRYLIAFSGIMVLLFSSSLVGYFIWRIRQKPLRDKALALLAEIHKEN